MSKLIANGIVIVALSLATASQAQVRVHARHHRHVVAPPASDVVVVRTPPPYSSPGFISNGVNFGAAGANGLSGDDSYPPPRGFHGGLYSYGVYAMGPGGPYDRVEGCAPGFSCGPEGFPP